MAPVVVLNNSRVTGLAHRVAGELRAAKWPVAAVGNLTGRWPRTTLYYGPGALADAEVLAHRFPEIRALAPRPPYLPAGRLVLVVTRYWAA